MASLADVAAFAAALDGRSTPSVKAATVGGDNGRSAENMVLLHPQPLAEPGHKDGTAARNPEQASAKPFTVFQPIPGQNPKHLFIIHAYSLEQARALVAAKVAGETIVVGPVTLRPTSPLLDALDGASQ